MQRKRIRRPRWLNRSIGVLLVALGIVAGVEIEHRFELRSQALEQAGPLIDETADLLGETSESVSHFVSERTAPDPNHTTLQGKVVKVVDGDTIDLLVERITHRIRLDQIDTQNEAKIGEDEPAKR